MLERIKTGSSVLGVVAAAAMAAAVPAGEPDQLPFTHVRGCNGTGTGAAGAAIDVSGWRAIIGDPAASTQPGLEGGCDTPPPPGIEEAGVAYIEYWDGTDWRVQAILTAADATTGDAFGFAVALDGDRAVVGAPGSDLGNGAAYVFERQTGGDSDGRWTQVAQLTGTSGPAFGSSVDIDGDVIVVGAPNEIDPGDCLPGDDHVGAAYVYRRQAGAWTLETRLAGCPVMIGDGDPPINGCKDVVFQEVHTVIPFEFGAAVAVSGDLVVVGAPGSQVGAWCPVAGPVAGAAYLFVRSFGTWDDGSILLPLESQTLAEFGFDVAIDGATVVVGQPYFDQTIYGEEGDPVDFVETGAVAIYDVEISLAQILTHAPPLESEGASDALFGYAVAVEENCTILVGAPGDAAGAVYEYTHVGIDDQPSWPFNGRFVSDEPLDEFLGVDVAVDERTALATTLPGQLAADLLHFIVTDVYSTHPPPLPDDGFDGPCLEWIDVPNETVARYECSFSESRYAVETLTPVEDAAFAPTVVASRDLDLSFLDPEAVSYDARYEGYDVLATLSWTQEDVTYSSDGRVVLDDALPNGIASVAVAEHPSGFPRVIGIVSPTGVPGDGVGGWGTQNLPLAGTVQVRLEVIPSPTPDSWRYQASWRLTEDDAWEAVTFADTQREATTLHIRTQAHADPSVPFGPITWERVRVEPRALPTCPGDTNLDNVVDVSDLVNIILAWGPTMCGDRWDFDESLAIDVGDLIIVILNWGPCP